MNLQKYVEINGSIAYLKSNTVKQIVSLKKYMCMLSDQDRPAAQKNNHLYHISGNKLFNLTACDMRTAMVNEKLENQKSCTTPASPMPHYTSPLSAAPMRLTILWELTPFKKGLKPNDPPQDVDKSHPIVSSSTTSNLNDTCLLYTSCEHLLRLDSSSLSSELQDNSFVESTEPESLPDSEDQLQLDSTCVSSQDASCIEMEFLPEFEGQLDHANLSPPDLFLEHHGYQLFLLQKVIDVPYDNLNHQDTHVCENQDDILIHANILSHTFALPQFMAQHNCEDLKPTENPSTAPTGFQGSRHHTFNPMCAHNLMATRCNQSQYLTMMKQSCAHNPSTSQARLINPLASPYPPDPGEHVLKKPDTEVGEQDFSVKWFKFIHPHPKQRMNETPVQKPVHLA